MIIINHNRKEYLQQAVDSAINQSLSPEKYEIIVVKGYPSKGDANLVSRGVEVIIETDKSYGKKVARAFEVARGNFIAFLDDDDLFLKDKLEISLNEFVTDDQLGYLHNAHAEMDLSGNPIESKLSRFNLSQGNGTIQQDTATARTALRWMRRGADFNHSSIVIRKEILDKFLRHFPEITGSFDTFAFSASLISGYKLKFTSNILTRYRIGASAGSQEISDLERRTVYLTKQLGNYRKILETLDPEDISNILDVLRYRIADTEITIGLLEGWNGKQIYPSLIRSIRCGHLLDLYSATKLVLVFIHLVSHRMSRTLYRILR